VSCKITTQLAAQFCITWNCVNTAGNLAQIDPDSLTTNSAALQLH